MATFSTTTRYTGLSGVDTESMVQQLMKAESVKYTKLKGQQQVLAWKQDAYRNVGTSLKTFQDSFLSVSANNSLRMPSSFNNRTASAKFKGADTNAATITSSANASFGNHSLNIEQVASKDVKKSQGSLARIKGGDASSLPLEELESADSEYAFELTFDGVTKKISLSKAEVEAINPTPTDPEEEPDAATIELSNKKLFDAINGKIRTAFASPDKLDFVTIGKNSEGNFEFGMQVGKHTMSVKKVEGSKDLLAAIGVADGQKVSSAIDTSKSLATVFGVDPTYSGSFKINGYNVDFTGEDTVDKIMLKVNDPKNNTGVKMSFSSYNGFTIESNNTGATSKISIEETNGQPRLLSDLFKMNISAASLAKDAIFTYDGIRSTSTTNDIEIDGMKFTLNKETPTGEWVDLTVSKDNTKVTDMITKFVEAYNNLIGGMNSSVEEKRTKKSSYEYYEPLTDEQKSAMKEDQIKEWEGKAKQGLLNRDEILSGITSTMRSFLYEPVSLGNDKSISLYEIGITTSSLMKDRGKLVIDKEKLSSALTNRMGDVETLFTKSSNISSADKSKKYDRLRSEGVAERLNDIVNDATGSSGSITLKAGIKGGVTDITSQMTLQMKDQDEKLRQLQEYLKDKENYYYTMFSKMESAMNSSNSQMSYLQSQFG